MDVDSFLRYLAVAAVAYLAGSIPFAFIWTLAFCRRDLRRVGTGNSTVYASYRNGGWPPAALTLVCNAGIGFAVVFLARRLIPGEDAALLVGLVFITVGAMWPLALAFSGGKGTTTMGWTMLFMSPPLVFALLGVWFAMLVVTRRTFTSSTVVYRTLPLTLGLVERSWQFALAGLVLSVLLHLKHDAESDDSVYYGFGRRWGVNKT